MTDRSTVMLPDGSELDLADLTEDELLELYESLNEGHFANSVTSVGTLVGGGFAATLDSCLGPTTWQTVEMAGKLFSFCLILRIMALVNIPTKVKHLVSCLTGVATFIVFFSEHSMLYHLLALCAGGYMFMFMAAKYKGGFVSLFCVAFLLTCEVFFVEFEIWNTVKGTFMIMSMKIISLSFDVERDVVTAIPDIVEYSGYILCPSSIIFGPFMMYKDYCQILKRRQMTQLWVLSIARSVSLGYIFLMLSSCFSPWIFPVESNKWLIAYQTALSFRCSNYFVGYLSESSCLLCGIGTVVKEDKNEKLEWKVPVSRPQHVEFPRSFAEIAIHWSVPNHVFLKNYVFARARKLGPFLSIFLTFGASSILHGLSFQIAAVLISIATYAYVEHVFRKKVARFLSMCVEARKCKPNCKHQFTESNYWVTVINLAFGFLNIFHLAYLGAMFDGINSGRGYGVEHTLGKWSELNYASHWIILGMYLVAVVL